MQARRKTRLYIVLAVLAGLGLTVSLTLYALSSNIDLFYTPGEIIYGKTETRALPHTGQRLRVGGYVQPGSTSPANDPPGQPSPASAPSWRRWFPARRPARFSSSKTGCR